LQADLIPDGRELPDLAPLGYRLRRQLLRRLPVPADDDHRAPEGTTDPGRRLSLASL
jgi:hypothetical protein